MKVHNYCILDENQIKLNIFYLILFENGTGHLCSARSSVPWNNILPFILTAPVKAPTLHFGLWQVQKNMIDPLNQSPGQPQKVPGIRIKARPDIYMPVHCTGNFMRDKHTGEKQIKTNIIYLFLFVPFIEKNQASGSSPSLLRPIRK